MFDKALAANNFADGAQEPSGLACVFAGKGKIVGIARIGESGALGQSGQSFIEFAA